MIFETRCVICQRSIDGGSFDRQEVVAHVNPERNIIVAACACHFVSEGQPATEYRKSLRQFALAVAATLVTGDVVVLGADEMQGRAFSRVKPQEQFPPKPSQN